jgi:hypothetical protein
MIASTGLTTFLVKVQFAHAASLTLTPSSGVAGQEVTITGSGFDNSSAVTILWDGQALTTTPSSVTSSGAGALPAVATTPVTFVVPAGSVGAHTVRAASGSGNIAVATFTTSTPAITVTPVLTTPFLNVGATLAIAATNFEGQRSINVYFDETLVVSGTTTVNGSYSGTFIIPTVTSTGPHIIRASTSTYAVATSTLSLAAPTITLNPATAVPGQTVTVTGTNFQGSTSVTLQNNGTTITTDAPIVTTSAGGFVATYTVKDLSAGTVTIKALSSPNLFAVATLTITAPTLTLSPATAPPGTTVTATGANFKASSDVTLTANGVNLALTTGGSTARTNAQGGFVVTFIAPDATAGASTIKAQGSDNLAATATLTMATTTLTLLPASGSDGVSISTTGVGFDSNSTVSFYMNGIQIPGASVTTTATGSFQYYLQLVSGIPSGAQTILAKTSEATYASATYTVTAATVVASPTSGGPGTRVTLTGLNFDSNAIVSFKWNSKTLATAEGQIITNSAGSFVANVVIPDTYSAGNNQIEVSTSPVNTILVNFALSGPNITLTPSTGTVGQKILIAGVNYEANQSINLTWDGKPLETDPASLLTTGTGGFNINVTVPNDSRGTHVITASAGSNSNFKSNATFTITAPSVTLSTTSSQPNAKITANGAGFAPNTDVSFVWDNVTPIATEPAATADSAGNFVTTLTIPSQTTAGSHNILVKTGSEVFTTLSYTVTAGTVTLSKANGPVNTTLQINGSGFDTNTPVAIMWAEKVDLGQGMQTDGIGGFVAQVKIPESQPGLQTISVATSKYGVASATFTVDASSLSISPEEPKAGSTVVLRGNSFAANKPVRLEVNGSLLRGRYKNIQTDASGNFVASVKISSPLDSQVEIKANTTGYDQTVHVAGVKVSPIGKTLKGLINLTVIGIILLIFVTLLRLVYKNRKDLKGFAIASLMWSGRRVLAGIRSFNDLISSPSRKRQAARPQPAPAPVVANDFFS